MINKEILRCRHWQGLEAASCFGCISVLISLWSEEARNRSLRSQSEELTVKTRGAGVHYILQFPNTYFWISSPFPILFISQCMLYNLWLNVHLNPLKNRCDLWLNLILQTPVASRSPSWDRKEKGVDLPFSSLQKQIYLEESGMKTHSCTAMCQMPQQEHRYSGYIDWFCPGDWIY